MRFIFAITLTVLTALSLPASAQDLDDVPTPEQLVQRVELRISTPDPGQVVQIPFTVNGVAPPGARLELWVGTQLQRVFIADASGKFTVPVSKPGEGAVIVHLMDGNEPVQSTSVDVVWGGSAADVAASPTSEPSPSVATAAPEDAKPETSAEPDKAPLPKVSELDAAYAAGEPLPVPQRANPTPDTGVNTDVQVETEAPDRPRPKPISRGLRGLAEAGIGTAAMAGGGLALGAAGLGLGLTTGDPWAALGATVVGGVVGMAVGLPLGVYFTGKQLDGNGRWWAVVLGEVSGLLAAGLLASVTPYELDGLAVFGFFALPITGAVVGYELSSDKSAWEAKYGVSISPTVTPSREGSPMFGLRLTF